MIKKDKKSVIWAVLAMVAMSATAASVDGDAAQRTALGFLRSNSSAKFMNSSASLRLEYAEPSAVRAEWADYYVFNATDGSAFVVVSGDDRAEAVLAYGEGAIDMDNIPCNLRWWFNYSKEQMEYLHAHPDISVNRSPSRASLVMEPLLPCTWNQTTPYNDYCPVYQGKRCVTGCVATAMAQVMYYWRFPDELPDLIGYKTNNLGIIMPDLPPTTLEWDEMLDSYYSYYLPDVAVYTPSQGAAIAKLMLYCGVSCYMDYSYDGSGAACLNQWIALQMFGYNPQSTFVHRDDYDTEAWEAMMLDDIANKRPILYAGYDSSGGHAFVIDGYDGSKYHINWGWEGSGDGYFALDAFNVGQYMFNAGHEMIYNLSPEGFGQQVTPYDCEVDGLYYKLKDNEATVTYREEIYKTYSGNVAIPEQVTVNGKDYAVTAIGNNAFRGSNYLTSVSIPSSVKFIGKYAFKDCSRLQEVTIPNSVEIIDYGAFMGCSRLSNLSLSNGLREIGNFAFSECMKLNSLTLPNSLQSLGKAAFMACTRIARLKTGNGLKEIGDGAFSFCYGMTEAVIGDNVTTLGESAFYWCTNLRKVTFGLSVDSIGPQAFAECYSLMSLTLKPEFVPVVDDPECFSETSYANATLYVPEGCEDDYRFAPVWDQFQNFVGIDMTADPADVNGDGEVNIADVNAVIAAILAGGGEEQHDVNGDGEVNIADVNAVITRILNN